MLETDQEHKVWMARAIALARKAEAAGEVPVGAVVVHDGEIIGEGYNQPILAHDPTAHAEIIALRDAARNQQNYRLSGSTLYVTIEPCTMCMGAIIHARVETVVFGALEPKAGALVSHLQLHSQYLYNHRPEIIHGVLAEQCRELITGFFRAKRSK